MSALDLSPLTQGTQRVLAVPYKQAALATDILVKQVEDYLRNPGPSMRSVGNSKTCVTSSARTVPRPRWICSRRRRLTACRPTPGNAYCDFRSCAAVPICNGAACAACCD